MELMVKAISLVAVRVIELELVHPQWKVLPDWSAGAHLDLILGNGLVRQYSLCSDPSDRNRYQVAVLEQDDSRGGSIWVHRQLQEGDRLEVRGPKNHFPLEDGPAYLFVAGGIGITPILPMVAETAARRVPFEVLYGGRARSNMAFVDRLAAQCERLTIVPENEQGRPDVAAAIERCAPGTLVYCCGPQPLLQAVEEECRRRPNLTLHCERFTVPDAEPIAPHEGDQPFEVHLRQSGRTLQVGVTQTLLEILQDAGAEVYSDCQAGVCGTCEVDVIDGAVDHRDSVLSATEKRSNTVMMACVSRAACPRLTLDL